MVFETANSSSGLNSFIFGLENVKNILAELCERTLKSYLKCKIQYALTKIH